MRYEFEVWTDYDFNAGEWSLEGDRSALIDDTTLDDEFFYVVFEDGDIDYEDYEEEISNFEELEKLNPQEDPAVFEIHRTFTIDECDEPEVVRNLGEWLCDGNGRVTITEVKE